LAVSLLLHASVYLVLAPSSGVSIGSELNNAVREPIYVTLKSLFPNDEREKVVSSGEVVIFVQNSDILTPARANKSAKNADETTKDGRIVSESTTAEIIKSTEAPVSILPPAPGYLFGAGLHRQPRLLNEISLDYPAEAGAREGHVTLRILVSERGAVDNLAVVRADQAGYFEEVALTAFARAVFAPGEFLGAPVKSQFFVEVEFTPINRGGVSGKGY